MDDWKDFVWWLPAMFYMIFMPDADDEMQEKFEQAIKEALEKD